MAALDTCSNVKRWLNGPTAVTRSHGVKRTANMGLIQSVKSQDRDLMNSIPYTDITEQSLLDARENFLLPLAGTDDSKILQNQFADLNPEQKSTMIMAMLRLFTQKFSGKNESEEAIEYYKLNAEYSKLYSDVTDNYYEQRQSSDPKELQNKKNQELQNKKNQELQKRIDEIEKNIEEKIKLCNAVQEFCGYLLTNHVNFELFTRERFGDTHDIIKKEIEQIAKRMLGALTHMLGVVKKLPIKLKVEDSNQENIASIDKYTMPDFKTGQGINALTQTLVSELYDIIAYLPIIGIHMIPDGLSATGALSILIGIITVWGSRLDKELTPVDKFNLKLQKQKIIIYLRKIKEECIDKNVYKIKQLEKIATLEIKNAKNSKDAKNHTYEDEEKIQQRYSHLRHEMDVFLDNYNKLVPLILHHRNVPSAGRPNSMWHKLRGNPSSMQQLNDCLKLDKGFEQLDFNKQLRLLGLDMGKTKKLEDGTNESGLEKSILEIDPAPLPVNLVEKHKFNKDTINQLRVNDKSIQSLLDSELWLINNKVDKYMHALSKILVKNSYKNFSINKLKDELPNFSTKDINKFLGILCRSSNAQEQLMVNLNKLLYSNGVMDMSIIYNEVKKILSKPGSYVKNHDGRSVDEIICDYSRVLRHTFNDLNSATGNGFSITKLEEYCKGASVDINEFLGILCRISGAHQEQLIVNLHNLDMNIIENEIVESFIRPALNIHTPGTLGNEEMEKLAHACFKTIVYNVDIVKDPRIKLGHEFSFTTRKGSYTIDTLYTQNFLRSCSGNDISEQEKNHFKWLSDYYKFCDADDGYFNKMQSISEVNHFTAEFELKFHPSKCPKDKANSIFCSTIIALIQNKFIQAEDKKTFLTQLSQRESSFHNPDSVFKRYSQKIHSSVLEYIRPMLRYAVKSTESALAQLKAMHLSTDVSADTTGLPGVFPKVESSGLKTTEYLYIDQFIAALVDQPNKWIRSNTANTLIATLNLAKKHMPTEISGITENTSVESKDPYKPNADVEYLSQYGLHKLAKIGNSKSEKRWPEAFIQNAEWKKKMEAEPDNAQLREDYYEFRNDFLGKWKAKHKIDFNEKCSVDEFHNLFNTAMQKAPFDTNSILALIFIASKDNIAEFARAKLRYIFTSLQQCFSDTNNPLYKNLREYGAVEEFLIKLADTAILVITLVLGITAAYLCAKVLVPILIATAGIAVVAAHAIGMSTGIIAMALATSARVSYQTLRGLVSYLHAKLKDPHTKKECKHLIEQELIELGYSPKQCLNDDPTLIDSTDNSQYNINYEHTWGDILISDYKPDPSEFKHRGTKFIYCKTDNKVYYLTDDIPHKTKPIDLNKLGFKPNNTSDLKTNISQCLSHHKETLATQGIYPYYYMESEQSELFMRLGLSDNMQQNPTGTSSQIVQPSDSVKLYPSIAYKIVDELLSKTDLSKEGGLYEEYVLFDAFYSTYTKQNLCNQLSIAHAENKIIYLEALILDNEFWQKYFPKQHVEFRIIFCYNIMAGIQNIQFLPQLRKSKLVSKTELIGLGLKLIPAASIGYAMTVPMIVKMGVAGWILDGAVAPIGHMICGDTEASKSWERTGEYVTAMGKLKRIFLSLVFSNSTINDHLTNSLKSNDERLSESAHKELNEFLSEPRNQNMINGLQVKNAEEGCQNFDESELNNLDYVINTVCNYDLAKYWRDSRRDTHPNAPLHTSNTPTTAPLDTSDASPDTLSAFYFE